MKLRNNKVYDSTDASWRRSKRSSKPKVKTAENPAVPTMVLDEKACPVAELQDCRHLSTSDATAPEIMGHSGKRRIPVSGGHLKKKPKRKQVKKNSVPKELTRTIDVAEKVCPVTQDSPAVKDPEIMDHLDGRWIQKVMGDVESVESQPPSVSEPSKDDAVRSNGGGDCKLRLFHRYMICEWFYCDMDRSLLGRECKVDTMEALLQRFYPGLCNRQLNRATWGRIRRSLYKEPTINLPRRCSSAFFKRQREYLNVGRNKIRAIQALRTSRSAPTLEYLDGDLPSVLPPSIETQATVRAHLDTDGHYGVFEGTVTNVAFDNLCSALYTVSFVNPSIGVKVVPDTHIAQTLPTGSASFRQCSNPSEHDVVWVPNTVPNLMALMHQDLAEQDAALAELQNLRHQIAAQQALGNSSRPRDHHELVKSYENCLQQVQSRGRSLTNQLGTMGTLYGKSVPKDGGGASLNIADALQDKNVDEIAQRLCSQPDVGAIACRTRWNNTVGLLHSVPARFHALREQIESKLNASK